MAKKIKDIRREELLQAAWNTFREVGVSKATVALVARNAGMAPGMVHHYFKSKSHLVEGAIRYANAELAKDILEATRLLDCPKEKIRKIVEVNFSEKWFNLGATRMWVTFCAEVPFNENFYRIQRVLNKRMESNLKFNLRQILIDEDEVSYVAYGVVKLIDGLWLEGSVYQEEGQQARAVHLLNRYLLANGV